MEKLPEDSVDKARSSDCYAITDRGTLEPNVERAEKYLKYLNPALYIASLRQKWYQKFERQ